MKSETLCPVCHNIMQYYAKGSYYLEDHDTIDTDFYFCKSCETFLRDISSSQVGSHLKAASYTNIKREDKYFKQRKKFFEYLFRLFKKYAKTTPSNWLDFGSSYGHFGQYLNSMGVKAHGIELNSDLVAWCNANDRKTFHNIKDIPLGQKYTVISFIDSLYMPKNPRLVLQELKNYLEKPGYLLVRITNRNWLAHYRTKILRKDLGNSLGAVTTGFSKNSINKLLEEEGFEVIKLTSIELGKSHPVNTKAFYILTEIIYLLTFGAVNICPGIIVIAKKN